MSKWYQKALDTVLGRKAQANGAHAPGTESSAEETTGRPRRVTVGLDFGTSTSKCCFREDADRKPFNFVLFRTAEGGSTPLFESALAFENGTVRFGPSAATVPAPTRSFKMCLLCQAQRDQGLPAQTQCPRCLPESPGSFQFGDLRVTAEDLCTLHLAVMLREILTLIPSALSIDPRRLRVQVNAAAPLDQMSAFGPVGEYFDRVFYYAFVLAQTGQARREWDIHEALRTLGTVRANPRPSQEMSPTRVFPETHAAITGYALLPQSKPGLYGIVDVGAGTTDVSFFWLQKNEVTAASYYAAGSRRIGMDDVDRVVGPLLKLPPERYRTGREALSVKELDRFRNPIQPIAQELFQHYCGVFERATQVDQRDWAWCDKGLARYTVFMVGGGAACPPMMDRVRKVPPRGSRWEQKPSLLGVPRSSRVTDGTDATTLHQSGLEQQASLLLLAYGLAYPRPEIPKFERDVEGVRRVEVGTQRFTPEELYGHT